MFKNVIARRPGTSITEGITSAPELGKPDHQLALRQHQAYCQALESCGVQVTVLPPLEEYPDSCFVEDTAVLTTRCAVITNPGAPSRRGEVDHMVDVIRSFYPADRVEFIRDPGTLEGGDVMMVGDTFYVGLSARTNREGIEQFARILGRNGFKVRAVPLSQVLHLKTGVNYLEGGNLLVSGEFVDHPEFASFNRIVVPPEEAYGANCIWVNGTVIVPQGYPTVEAQVRDLGYRVILVDTSEFRKIDGGLSCLSLRF
ncbi:Dimethylargininase [Thermanaerovibrio acidaminovorans DSM 6589]|uniref:Dimethylargininase n=1 Tax=Thermanaerovibrio acidaminovorans (strain ATCC 49978 / DSM 6589 / Su883) TaxID=525903 RepID=D1B7W4_THEAS|nr:arginine deiminase family protein [Thermanaerovibrio acidaminovorans]ACZ18367.1 Dimethylargininase [Thermanaerovibrio acidaminovorans DSM 6589]